MFIDLEPPKKRCLDRCGENPTALRASIRWGEKLKFVSANKSRTEVGWNACNQRSQPGERQRQSLLILLSESQRRVWVMRKLET
jgi:hypothetical protein